jgi:hypothetical protein
MHVVARPVGTRPLLFQTDFRRDASADATEIRERAGTGITGSSRREIRDEPGDTPVPLCIY